MEATRHDLIARTCVDDSGNAGPRGRGGAPPPGASRTPNARLDHHAGGGEHVAARAADPQYIAMIVIGVR